jgi:hypothetical protein
MDHTDLSTTTGPRSGEGRFAPLTSLNDDELLGRLSALVKSSRSTEADLLRHLAEADARRLYARQAAPSMFVYCTLPGPPASTPPCWRLSPTGACT